MSRIEFSNNIFNLTLSRQKDPEHCNWGLGLSLIHSKGICGWWSRYGMWYLISKLSKSFYNESDLLFLLHHWGRLTSDLRGVSLSTKKYCGVLSKWDCLIKMRATFLAPILTRVITDDVMKEEESKKAALAIRHLDETLILIGHYIRPHSIPTAFINF